MLRKSVVQPLLNMCPDRGEFQRGVVLGWIMNSLAQLMIICTWKQVAKTSQKFAILFTCRPQRWLVCLCLACFDVDEGAKVSTPIFAIIKSAKCVPAVSFLLGFTNKFQQSLTWKLRLRPANQARRWNSRPEQNRAMHWTAVENRKKLLYSFNDDFSELLRHQTHKVRRWCRIVAGIRQLFIVRSSVCLSKLSQ